MGMLYELCSMCAGTGDIHNVRLNSGEVVARMDCVACKPLRVVPVGVTAAQLDRLVKDSLVKGKTLAQELFDTFGGQEPLTPPQS